MNWLVWFVMFIKLWAGVFGDTECYAVDLEKNSSLSSFRLVQYNMEWLFMDYYPPMNCPGSGCTWVNISEANIHLSYVSNIVHTLSPHIMNTCEVEGCDELRWLNTVSSSNYTAYLKKGTDTATGQNAGLLSVYSPLVDLYRTEEHIAYPIAGSNCGYHGNGTVGVTKHYITEYVWYGRNVVLIGAHLLAYPEDSTRCAEREAQAQVLQNVVYQYVKKGYEIVVMGDFNDFDGRVLDRNNNKPLSRVLDILKGYDGVYSGSYLLHSAAEKMEQSERYSDWWDMNGDCVATMNEFSMIDHVLVSPFLFDKIKKAFIYHGYVEYCGKYQSDHFPVVVDFL